MRGSEAAMRGGSAAMRDGSVVAPHKSNMGAAAIRALSCEALAKYWLNVMHCESSCCGDWCSCVYTTDLVEPSRDESDFEVELIGCCAVRKESVDASSKAT